MRILSTFYCLELKVTKPRVGVEHENAKEQLLWGDAENLDYL